MVSGQRIARDLAPLIAFLALVAAPQSDAQPPARKYITANDLARLRDIDALAVSPNGEWAAFQVREPVPSENRYEQSWRLTEIGRPANTRVIADAGFPAQQTQPEAGMRQLVGVVTAQPPAWSPDSRWIAYVRSDSDRKQIWRTRRDGRRSEQLTHNGSEPRTLVYSRDGQRILFDVEPSLAQIQPALAREGLAGFHYDRRISPYYDRIPTMPAAHASSDGGVWVYDIAVRKERPATEAEREEFAALINSPALPDRPLARGSTASGQVAQSPGGALAWTEALDPERQGAYPPLTIMARQAGAEVPVACTASGCTGQVIRGVWWRSENEILFARGEGNSFNESTLYSWTIGSATVRQILRTPGRFTKYHTHRSNCAVAQDKLICFQAQVTTPDRLAAIDLDDGSVETLYDPNPQFRAFDLGPSPEFIAIRTESGVETYGYLVLPPQRPARERLPLVIVAYRCQGFLRGSVGDEYPIYPLAADGFAVLCFNAPEDYGRLSRVGWDEYGEWAQGPGNREMRSIQDALNAAVARLADSGAVDKDRVALTGLSHGANITKYALFNMPNLSTAIASGIWFEPSHMFLSGDAFGHYFDRWGFSSPSSPRWDEFALSRNVDKVRASLLLNAADHEMLMALEPVVALRRHNRAVDMYIYPDEYHQKWQPAHRLAIYNRNIDWMNFWLRGAESGLTGDALQYTRWRAMRESQCRLFGPGGSEYVADIVPWYCRPGAMPPQRSAQ